MEARSSGGDAPSKQMYVIPVITIFLLILLVLIAPTVESESDHEPTSTVTIPTPPQIPEPDLEETSKTVAVKSPVHNRSSKFKNYILTRF